MSPSVAHKGMSHRPHVSVVIPAHNEERYLGSTLDALNKQSYPPNCLEIYVINNNSTDNTESIARNYNVHVVNFDKGPVGAVRNIGVRESTGEILFFLDADCIPPVDWIDTGVQLIQRFPDTVFGGYCLLRDNPSWIERFWLLKSATPFTSLLGASIVIRRSDFMNAGLFDEEVTSGEDSKLTDTLRAIGIMIRMTHDLSVVHLGNPTSIHEFISRQVWHSENYFQDMQRTLRDKTFYIVACFLVFLITSIILALLSTPKNALIALSLALTCPAILSLKRIMRSADRWRNVKHSLPIYFVDLCYLTGRSIGLLKSLKRKF